MKDTVDMFRDKDRGRFDDNESVRGNDSVRSDLVDLTLTLRNDRKPLAIAVSKPDSREWVWLPKSRIEYRTVGGANVEVTLPARLAREKGLI